MSSAVSLGIVHTICLDAEGSLWSFGRNDYGQTGHDIQKSKIEKPERISCLPQIHGVSCGHFHTVCVDGNGIVWSFGRNENGQLGHSNGETIPFPLQVEGLPPVNSVCCGTSHTICLVENSTIWGFGRNQEGQLGFEGLAEQHTPIQIPGVEDVIRIAAGGHQTIVMDGSEFLFAAGGNYYGQLGLGLAVGKVSKFTQIRTDKNIIEFACGLLHTIFLDSEGNVYGAGCNNNRQIGVRRSGGGAKHSTLDLIDNTLRDIKKVSCGNTHTICSDGNSVFLYGDNTFKQCEKYCGSVHEIEASVLSVGGNHTIIKDAAGTIFVCGNNSFGQLGIGARIRNVGQFMKLPEGDSHIIDEYWVAYRRPGFRSKSARH